MWHLTFDIHRIHVLTTTLLPFQLLDKLFWTQTLKMHNLKNKLSRVPSIRPWLKSWTKAYTHGIMGTPMPNKFSYLRPRPDGKYTTYDHARTANTIPNLWLVSWDLMRPIGGELVTTITSPSCWGTHFLYLSNRHLGTPFPLFHALKYSCSHWKKQTERMYHC